MQGFAQYAQQRKLQSQTYQQPGSNNNHGQQQLPGRGGGAGLGAAASASDLAFVSAQKRLALAQSKNIELKQQGLLPPRETAQQQGLRERPRSDGNSQNLSQYQGRMGSGGPAAGSTVVNNSNRWNPAINKVANLNNNRCISRYDGRRQS